MFTSCHFRLHNYEHLLLNYEHPELFVWKTTTENLSAKRTTACIAFKGFTKSHNVSVRKSTGTYIPRTVCEDVRTLFTFSLTFWPCYTICSSLLHVRITGYRLCMWIISYSWSSLDLLNDWLTNPPNDYCISK